MLALMPDRSDSNAPNQAMVFSQAVKEEKITLLEETGHNDLSHAITLDSPVPYRISSVIKYLNTKTTRL